MRHCVIVGQPNTGKTLFLLQFAAYLGLSVLDVRRLEPEGRGTGTHRTRRLQSVEVRFPLRKSLRAVRLTDTPGLTDDVHPEAEVRRAMAAALQAFREAGLVLHMLDAARAGELGAAAAIGRIDRQIAAYASLRGPYAVLANKIDLPLARDGAEVIAREFPGRRVIPISALERLGFREVKAFVWRNA